MALGTPVTRRLDDSPSTAEERKLFTQLESVGTEELLRRHAGHLFHDPLDIHNVEYRIEEDILLLRNELDDFLNT